MINLIQTKAEPKPFHQMSSNESLLLDNPQVFWQLQSGTIALFAVTVIQGVPEGSRYYLFSVKPGELLLGTTFLEGQGILAVAIEDSELLQVSSESFMQQVKSADQEAIALLENWIHKLGAVNAASIDSMHGYTIHSTRLSHTLEPRQRGQSALNTVSWVQIQAGKAKWIGFESLTLNAASGIVPIGEGIWLEAVGEVELAARQTSDIQDSDILIAGLEQLQAYCLRCVDLLEQRSLKEELQRFREREQLNQQVTESALNDLAAVLQPRSSGFGYQGTALLTAAGAVGRALAIEIRPPARSETMERVKEPIEAIARASKVRMRRVLLTGNWWRKDCGPLLAYTLCDNQPVALLPTSATRYELFDPVNLTRTPVDHTIQTQLAPEAYTFYRSLPQTALTALDVLKFGLKGHMSDLGIVFLAGIIITLIEMLTPQATATIIDSAIPGSDRGLLLQIGLGLFAVAIAAAVFHLVQGFAMLRAETLIDSSTQAALWDRLLNLSIPFFRTYSTGDLQSRVSAISKIHQTLSGTTLSTLFSSFFSLLNLALLLYYNAPLALIAVLVVLMIVAYSTAVGAINLRNVRSLERLRGKILGLTVQLISGVTKLRVAAAETRAFAYWSQQYTQQQKLVLRTEKFENNLAVFNELLPLVSSMLIFTFTVLATQQTSGLSIGTFLAFNAAFGSFMSGATSLSNSVMNILSIVAFWELAKPILEAKPEVDEYKADPGKLSGKLLVDHVTFRYGDDGPITLEDVSLSAKPGEFIALVGPSGSGKSTIFRLLLGFETPESGEVYYDNQALAGLDVLAVRRQLGVVLQQSQVLSTSIFENIAGNALITMDEAWEAARHAGFAEDIAGMPMGMHTVISEGGTNLSGGQKQRLLIARALALKPKILLFDEATSALDNRTQAIISESLDKLKVTRVVVAHRLSTIRNADRIYVLQAGRVVQQGCFQELAEQEGLFARLMAPQIS